MRKPDFDGLDFSRELERAYRAREANLAAMRTFALASEGLVEAPEGQKDLELLIAESYLILGLIQAMEDGDFTTLLAFASANPATWQAGIHLLLADVEDEEELQVRTMLMSNKLNRAHAPLHAVMPQDQWL